jgi:two-component system LytT family response regulator
MQKIRTVIVDDEKNSIITVQKLAEKYTPEIEVVGTAQSVAEAVEVIKEKKPDLVFLDISMPDGDGFNVLEKLNDLDFKVVFITAYDQYAIKAFEFAALHYLLKPIKGEDLQHAIERFREENEKTDLNVQVDLLKNLLSQNELKRLVLSTSTGIHIIDIDDIVRCESSNNYTTFFFKDGKKIIVSKSIQIYEKLLSPYHFCRVHNKHIVNLKYVKKYVKGRGGHLLLDTGEQIDVSEGRKKAFLEKLEKYTIG